MDVGLDEKRCSSKRAPGMERVRNLRARELRVPRFAACAQTRRSAEVQPNGILGSKAQQMDASARSTPSSTLQLGSHPPITHRIRPPLPWPGPCPPRPSRPSRSAAPVGSGCAASLPSRINPFTTHPVSPSPRLTGFYPFASSRPTASLHIAGYPILRTPASKFSSTKKPSHRLIEARWRVLRLRHKRAQGCWTTRTFTSVGNWNLTRSDELPAIHRESFDHDFIQTQASNPLDPESASIFCIHFTTFA